MFVMLSLKFYFELSQPWLETALFSVLTIPHGSDCGSVNSNTTAAFRWVPSFHTQAFLPGRFHSLFLFPSRKVTLFFQCDSKGREPRLSRLLSVQKQRWALL